MVIYSGQLTCQPACLWDVTDLCDIHLLVNDTAPCCKLLTVPRQLRMFSKCWHYWWQPRTVKKWKESLIIPGGPSDVLTNEWWLLEIFAVLILRTSNVTIIRFLCSDTHWGMNVNHSLQKYAIRSLTPTERWEQASNWYLVLKTFFQQCLLSALEHHTTLC